ncbi:hypothetical protein QQ008_23105 [Fulvivirgaceae bacterium BMA10]|uniref:Uncharacterized protein n=1 Tax=Splendidivirga corallicola TaxID=3051826 RepID=A0ABT8KY10_9BACT|nr:hypothetical protein [Fulvivirgaceae bacterium BMA10]
MTLTLFCKVIDNTFSLEKYRNNEIFMIGDHVEIRDYFFVKKKGLIIDIIKREPVRIDKFDVVKLKVKINGKTKNYCPKKTKVLDRGKYLPFDIADNYEFWIEEIKKDPFEIFDTVDNIDFRSVYDDFFNGLLSLQTRLPESLSISYFKRSIQRGNHILSNELLEKSNNNLEIHSIKIKILRSIAYSMAFVSNKPDHAKLLETANLIKSKCSKISSGYWWAGDQDFYLSAVRALIIADDLDTARDFLKSKRSFSKHTEQRRILIQLLKKQSNPDKDVQLRKDCYDFTEYTYYNIASYSSYFSTCYTFIEWNAIYYKFFISQDFTVDWNYVYKSLKDFTIAANR